MRIISKIHDYYDGALRSSVSDKTYTFIRETKELPDINYNIPSAIEIEGKKFNWNLYPGFIGFCGKVYPFYKVVKFDNFNQEVIEESCHYSMDTLNKLGIDLGVKRKTRRWYSDYDIKAITKWLEKGTNMRVWGTSYDINKDHNIINVFKNERVAYFVYLHTGRGLGYTFTRIREAYPILKDYDFGKVFDSYSAFQEIEMYLTNILVKPDEIKQGILDTITDDLKAQSKGYDKWSFRRMPKEKK